ncbi:MAG: dethiobiotin synthase [Thiobacillus sp.]
MSPAAPVRGYFVTGTDTGVGKTRVAVALIHALRAQGLRVAAMKPVAAGHAPGALNEDVAALIAASNVPADLCDVNPYAFEPAIAPHIAAAQAGVCVDLDVIRAAQARLAARADAVVVEGAGGWRVPLNEHQDMADLAQALGLPVVLVVGLRLGCLSHALLTAESVARRSLAWGGWVGNAIDPAMVCRDENIAALRACLPGPCLGIFSYQPEGSAQMTTAQSLVLPDS